MELDPNYFWRRLFLIAVLLVILVACIMYPILFIPVGILFVAGVLWLLKLYGEGFSH